MTIPSPILTFQIHNPLRRTQTLLWFQLTSPKQNLNSEYLIKHHRITSIIIILSSIQLIPFPSLCLHTFPVKPKPIHLIQPSPTSTQNPKSIGSWIPCCRLLCSNIAVLQSKDVDCTSYFNIKQLLILVFFFQPLDSPATGQPTAGDPTPSRSTATEA
ncbi:hypothetical protein Droror1_Dr00002465 [Drosera rotundifolia]